MNPEDFYDSRPRWVSLHEIEFERFRDEVDRSHQACQESYRLPN